MLSKYIIFKINLQLKEYTRQYYKILTLMKRKWCSEKENSQIKSWY